MRRTYWLDNKEKTIKKFIDSKIDAVIIAYNKQHNYHVSLIRKEKKPIAEILKYVT